MFGGENMVEKHQIYRKLSFGCWDKLVVIQVVSAIGVFEKNTLKEEYQVGVSTPKWYGLCLLKSSVVDKHLEKIVNVEAICLNNIDPMTRWLVDIERFGLK